MTPAHDWNDFEIGKRHGLTPLNIFNKDGTINENGGKYAGMDRFICRKALWEDMAAGNLVIKTELHELNVPRSQRGGDVVEPVVSWQWFMKMDSVALQSIDAVKNNDLQIIPARFEKNWFHWMENIHDWCISRQLVWGHRIPVYYVTSDEGSPEVQTDFIVARDEAHAQEIATKRYGRPMRLTQDPDVLDTWFRYAH